MKPAPTVISKSMIKAHANCPRRAWLTARAGLAESISLERKMLIEQGDEVQNAYRGGYPKAELVNTRKTLSVAAVETDDLLEMGQTQILEAAFVGAVGSVTVGVRVDVLQVEGEELHLTEIKAAGSAKTDYIDDCAIQLMALEATGKKVASVKLALLDTSKRLPDNGDYMAVFKLVDVMESARARVPVMADMALATARTLSGDAEPTTACGDQCFEPYACGYIDHCGAKKDELPLQDVFKVRVSADRREMMLDAINAKKAVVREELVDAISELAYPRRYLDFESVGRALPQFPGMKPFEQMVFQYSIHQEDYPGAQLRHIEYINLKPCDPRREVADSLVRDLEHEGPILVYSHFERERMIALKEYFADLTGAMDKVINRLVDLLPLARKGYYHPKMNGSWSIKAIAPTLPGAIDAYKSLKGISNGLEAQCAYLRAVSPDCSEDERESIRVQSCEYCAVDTKELHRFVATIEQSAVCV